MTKEDYEMLIAQGEIECKERGCNGCKGCSFLKDDYQTGYFQFSSSGYTCMLKCYKNTLNSLNSRHSFTSYGGYSLDYVTNNIDGFEKREYESYWFIDKYIKR